MIEKTCRCGKTKKNFKVDIGPFFVDECCIEAGYDEVGNLKKKPMDLTGLPSQEELEQQAANLQPDTSPEPEDPAEQEEEQTEETEESEETEQTEQQPEQPKEETKEEKKARLKAEKAADAKAKREAAKAAKATEQKSE